jgi:dTDP-4-dehydrorhamnose 3,5-epimerase
MSEFDPTKHPELKEHETKIPGLLEFDLAVHGDNRGWFKENFQREKMVALGLPSDFEVVQNNVSFNKKAGVTRGIHAEPWDKFISMANGKVFAVIVDFRDGDNFGTVETFELDPGRAIYVPRGCGNSFQTLEEDTVYAYLVNAHWSPEAKYTLVNLADPELAIPWPIPLAEAEISEKDKGHPMLNDIEPMDPATL